MKKHIQIIISLLSALALLASALCVFALAADTNLALGKPYTITSEAKIDNAYPNLANTVNDTALTDGKKGTAGDTSTNWNRLYRGLNKSIVIDLGSEMYINKIAVGFLNATSAGVHYPRIISYAVSVDGENFSTVYDESKPELCLSSKRERISCTFTADGYYAARYVRVLFSCDVFCFVDEIEVYGTETKPASLIPVTVDEEKVYPNQFVANDKEIMDGATDICLIYNGMYYRGEVDTIGNHDKDNFIPYVAYVGADRKTYTDTMFDSFLFLPLAPDTKEVIGDGSFSKQQGWEYYIDNTMGAEDGVNLTALDAAVAEVKEKLGLDDDYKVNIFLTVPTPPNSAASFGTLGGTSSISSNTLENCEKIVKWFVDLSIEKFNEQNFKNLNLTGFYWYNELIRYSSVPYDEELIKYFTDYCHSCDCAAIWIPYYCSPGFTQANELGFDAAALQTGYAFPNNKTETGEPQLGTCYDSMSMAKKYGLGVEIELSLVSDAVARYTDYILQSYLLGNMENGIAMYYQSGGDGDFYKSAANTSNRKIYDLTYQHIKKTLSIEKPVMDTDEAITLIIDVNNQRNKGNLPILGNNSFSSSLSFVELVRPEHGSLTIEPTGFFFYTPEEGYIGKDSFSFVITNGYYDSERYTVSIEIVDKAIYCDKVNSKLLNNKVVIFTDMAVSAPENDEAYEVAVDKDGMITAVGQSSGIAIPEGGFVISASGEKTEQLKENAVVGTYAVYDKYSGNIAFYAEAPADDSSAEDTESAADASSSSNAPVDDSDFPIIPIVAAVAVVIIAVAVVVIIKKSKGAKK